MDKRRHMHRREVEGNIRFLTFSCYQRLQLFNNDAIKKEFVDSLANVQKESGLTIIAWVLMPEHVHLLVVPPLPRESMTDILASLKTSVGKRVLNRWRKLNAAILPRLIDSRGYLHFWQTGGGYDRNIYSREEMMEKRTYIHCNPVKRGLVEHGHEWPWSSARWYRGDRSGPIVISEA